MTDLVIRPVRTAPSVHDAVARHEKSKPARRSTHIRFRNDCDVWMHLWANDNGSSDLPKATMRAARAASPAYVPAGGAGELAYDSDGSWWIRSPETCCQYAPDCDCATIAAEMRGND